MTRQVNPLPLGWPLLPVVDEGRMQWPSLEESVRQRIRVILLTRPGEQLMRPEFGAGLDQFLHEPNTLLTRRRIRDRVAESVNRWEPRVDLERVEVSENGERPNAVRVEIVYRLIRTGATLSMMLTLSLGS